MYYLHHDEKAARPERMSLIATPAELTHFIDSFQRILRLKDGVMTALEKEFLRRFDRGFDYFSTAEFSAELDIPGLIIHDQGDAVAPVHGAHTLAENWTDSELIITSGLGHSVQSDEVRKLSYQKRVLRPWWSHFAVSPK